MHAILDHLAGELQDDATAMLVEWRGHAAEDRRARAQDDDDDPAS
jgi:hypothetical protein